jgi:hypothetical protein
MEKLISKETKLKETEKMIRKINTNKKAQSLMISYVILVAIVIGISIGVFIWLKQIANVEPAIDCKEGTSIILTKIVCSNSGIDLYLKNNGRFNVEGIILTISNESKLTNPTYVIPLESVNAGNSAGGFFFNEELKPDNNLIANYSIKTKKIVGTSGFGASEPIEFDEVKSIQIQPFIYDERGIIICQDALIKQEISDCILS